MVKEYGYEYDAALDENLWRKCEGKTANELLWGAQCFRSGRDTLKAIAREFKPCVALLPALSCDSMVLPFEQYGHEIRYYKLKEDYSIDIESLRFGEGLNLFLYMDYFGCPSISDKDLFRLREKGNIVFIEDRTHNLIWDRASCFEPDFTMASLRKWLPIPDGGLLWGTIKKIPDDDLVFSSSRLKAQLMRHEFLKCGDERIKTEYRQLFSTVSGMLNGDSPSRMSAYALELAKKADLQRLQSVRRKNAEVLISILSSSRCISLIQKETGLSDLYVAFTVPNRDEVQQQLSAKGIFNTIIWPLSAEQKNICRIAKLTEENMLAAPCDQRYGCSDMEFIGKEIVRVAEDVNK